MIVYALTNGLAHDLRYEQDGYKPLAGERSIPGWGTLPDLDSLSDAAALAAREKQSELDAAKARALRAMDDKRLEAALADPTAPKAVKDYDSLLKALR